MLNIVNGDDIWQFTWAMNLQSIIKHEHTNMVAIDRVISVGDGIDNTFKPGKFRILRQDLELPIVIQILELTQLGTNKVTSLDNQAWYGFFKGHFLDDIKASSCSHVRAIKPLKTNTSLWEKKLTGICQQARYPPWSIFH